MGRKIKTVLRYYYCNTDGRWGQTPPDIDKYKKITSKNKAWKRRLYRSGISDYEKSKKWYEKIKSLHRSVVELDTEYVFDDQWNTTCGLRLFDWAEAGYDNKFIHEGYYLDLTQEMYDIRKNTYKCSFCGESSQDPECRTYCGNHEDCESYGWEILTKYTANLKEIGMTKQERNKEIIKMYLDGFPIKEIASKFAMNSKTVETVIYTRTKHRRQPRWTEGEAGHNRSYAARRDKRYHERKKKNAK